MPLFDQKGQEGRETDAPCFRRNNLVNKTAGNGETPENRFYGFYGFYGFDGLDGGGKKTVNTVPFPG